MQYFLLYFDRKSPIFVVSILSTEIDDTEWPTSNILENIEFAEDIWPASSSRSFKAADDETWRRDLKMRHESACREACILLWRKRVNNQVSRVAGTRAAQQARITCCNRRYKCLQVIAIASIIGVIDFVLEKWWMFNFNLNQMIIYKNGQLMKFSNHNEPIF